MDKARLPPDRGDADDQRDVVRVMDPTLAGPAIPPVESEMVRGGIDVLSAEELDEILAYKDVTDSPAGDS